MSIQKQFKEFNNTISISKSDSEYKEVREKDESILGDIKASFKEAGYPVESNFLYGSLSTHSAIRSLDGDIDLDRAIVIKGDDAPEDPVTCKLRLRDVLVARNFKEPKIKIPCVTADYIGSSFHLDYTIYSKSMFGSLSLAVGKEHSTADGRFWQDGDPQGLIAWTNGGSHPHRTTEQRDQCRRCIRFLKRWRDVVFTNESSRDKIYSIALTVMCIEQYSSSFEDGAPSDLDAMLDTVGSILNVSYFQSTSFVEEKYDVVVKLPTNPYRDIFAKHGQTVGTQLRNKFKNLKSKLEDAKEEENLEKQCEILRKVFGNDFPEGKSQKNKSAAIVNSSGGLVPSVGGA